MMRGYLVDPFEQTVAEVETSGYPHFKELIKVDLICAVSAKIYDNEEYQFMPKRDTLWVDDEGLFVEGQAYFHLAGYPQPLAGRGILLGTDEEGETVGAYMEFKEFKKMIEFLPNIELDRIENIPEGTKEYSPIFEEEVPVVGSYPVFRHKSKSDE